MPTPGTPVVADLLTERQLSKFGRLLGRQPTDAEKVQLYRLKDALGLDENDETWLFILALQHFEWLYEKHPARIQAAITDGAAQVKAAAEEAVTAEVARVQGMLEREVAAAALSVAAARTETSRRLARWWAGAGLALFGGFALVCGYELGRGGLPFWMHPRAIEEGGAAARVIGAILGAPAGWTALLLLMPVALALVRRGWARGRDEAGRRIDRAKGWAQLAGAALGLASSLAVLAWFVGGFWVPRPLVGTRMQHSATLSAPGQSGVQSVSEPQPPRSIVGSRGINPPRE